MTMDEAVRWYNKNNGWWNEKSAPRSVADRKGGYLVPVTTVKALEDEIERLRKMTAQQRAVSVPQDTGRELYIGRKRKFRE